MTYDVGIVGLGPTGRGLAYRCARAGLSVVAVDPRPNRVWHPTYAAWTDELPAWLSTDVIAAQVERPEVFTTHHRVTSRPYCVLDKVKLHDALDLTGVQVRQTRASALTAQSITTAEGEIISCGVTVDARGLPAVGRRQTATAHGIFVPIQHCKQFLSEDQALLLDWRPENGATNAEPPSFLYAVPIGDGTILYEEINIGLRTGLTQRELRRRTIARLNHHGVKITGDERTEAARYVLDQAPPSARLFGREALPFGSRGGMMHPCTGYSVVNSLARADDFANALTAGRNPLREVWTTQARLTYWMRMRGLTGLGRLTYEQSKSMFDAFFDQSNKSQFALLSAHAQPARMGTVLFSTVAHTWPFHWRFDLVGWTHRKRWGNWTDIAPDDEPEFEEVQ